MFGKTDTRTSAVFSGPSLSPSPCQQEASHQDHFGRQSTFRIYNRICQWYETAHLVLEPTRSEEEEQIDLEPEQLTLLTQKQLKRATSSRRLCTTNQRQNCETLIRRASELASFARTVENGQFYITIESVQRKVSSTPFLSCERADRHKIYVIQSPSFFFPVKHCRFLRSRKTQ